MGRPAVENSREAMVPIFGTNDSGDLRQFLGSGGIIGDGSLLLTAEHVIRPWVPKPIFIWADSVKSFFHVEPIESDAGCDLALLRINEYRPAHPFQPLFDYHLSCNIDLMTLEYSSTVVEMDPVERKVSKVHVNPAVRMGHMTRHIDDDRMGRAGIGALELSFPALAGASGAPVLLDSVPTLPDEYRFGVVGVLISNREYELQPARIVTDLYADNSTLTETHYMLPQGLAVAISHLRPMYERAIGG